VQGVGGRLAPDLAEWGRQWGLTEFAAAMWNKERAMSALLAEREMSMPQIGGVEMADLVAFLYSIEYFAEPGDAELGEQRLAEKDCLGCHALRGEGGSTASDLSLLRGLDSPAAVIASMWNHSLLMEGSEAVAWPRLTPEEMADLTAFLQAAARER
jgi:mono/diheme cytochrome c family protein